MVTMIAAGINSIHLALAGENPAISSVLTLQKRRGQPSPMHAFGTHEYAPVFPRVA